jgi:hypothetical protein
MLTARVNISDVRIIGFGRSKDKKDGLLEFIDSDAVKRSCKFLKPDWAGRAQAVDVLRRVNGGEKVAIPRGDGGSISITDDEISETIKGLKIYYDLGGLEFVAASFKSNGHELTLSDPSRRRLRSIDFNKKSDLDFFLKKFIRVKLGLEESTPQDKERFEILSPLINFTFDSKKTFQAIHDGSGVIFSPISSISPISSKLCNNILPNFESVNTMHYKYYFGKRGGFDSKKADELREIFWGINDLLLKTALAEGKACCFLQPQAFLRGLDEESRNIVLNIWVRSVLGVIKKYDDKIRLPTFIYGDKKVEEKLAEFSRDKLEHSELYYISGYDISKLDITLGERCGIRIMNPAMAHPSAQLANGAIEDRAESAAEEYLFRTHSFGLFLKKATDGQIDKWISKAIDVSNPRFFEKNMTASVSAEAASRPIILRDPVSSYIAPLSPVESNDTIFINQTPSSSPHLSPIATEIYAPSTPDSSVFSGTARGNRFRVVQNLYSDYGDIEKTMGFAIIKIARDSGLDIRGIKGILETARSRGGISHLYDSRSDKYSKSDHLDSKDRQVSAHIQSINKALGIFTGRDYTGRTQPPAVGLRTAHIPQSVIDKLEEFASVGATEIEAHLRSKMDKFNLEKSKQTRVRFPGEKHLGRI